MRYFSHWLTKCEEPKDWSDFGRIATTALFRQSAAPVDPARVARAWPAHRHALLLRFSADAMGIATLDVAAGRGFLNSFAIANNACSGDHMPQLLLLTECFAVALGARELRVRADATKTGLFTAAGFVAREWNSTGRDRHRHATAETAPVPMVKAI